MKHRTLDEITQVADAPNMSEADIRQLTRIINSRFATSRQLSKHVQAFATGSKQWNVLPKASSSMLCC